MYFYVENNEPTQIRDKRDLRRFLLDTYRIFDGDNDSARLNFSYSEKDFEPRPFCSLQTERLKQVNYIINSFIMRVYISNPNERIAYKNIYHFKVGCLDNNGLETSIPLESFPYDEIADKLDQIYGIKLVFIVGHGDRAFNHLHILFYVPSSIKTNIDIMEILQNIVVTLVN